MHELRFGSQMIIDFARAAGRFLRDNRAGATAYSAVGIVIMTVGGTALIVDHNRLVDRRDLLQSAADAASMSATLELGQLPGSMSDSDMRERLMSVARKYAVLNVLENVGDPDLEPADIEVTLDIDQRAGTVGASVQADIVDTVMSHWILGYSGPGRVVRKSGVESVGNPVEVVLAIDTSGSMELTLGGSGPSRMSIVKRAAADLVDILEPGEGNQVAIGVVPWSILVRLDHSARAGWVSSEWTAYPLSRHYAASYWCTPYYNCKPSDVVQTLPSEPGEAWEGCLDEHRISTGEHAALPAAADLLDHPSESGFAQSIFPAFFGRAYECIRPPLPGNYLQQDCYGEKTAEVQYVYRRPPQAGCSSIAAMLPLTSDRAAIETAIASLWPTGKKTYSALGVLWGQRMLSHSWNDAWGGGVHPVNPDAGGNAGTRKVIVLLTDGADTHCGPGEPDCTTTNAGVGRTVACDAAKAAGTEIFVIAAMPPDQVSGELGTALRACSSEDNNPDGSYVFLNNQNPDDLRAAFADIANQLRTVRRVF